MGVRAPETHAPSSSSPLGGLDPNIAAAISYIWIVGVIFFILEKENKFVRFHALQSILFGVANSVLMILLGILWSIPTLGLLVTSFRSRDDAATSGWWAALFNPFADAMECAKCGGSMVRTGSCYTCRDCGTNTGCS